MYQRGMTLIELLTAVTVLAILITLAMPSFRALIASNRQQVVTHELLTVLRGARTEAIVRQQPVILQPLDGNWANGWRMVADVSGRGLQDSENPVLRVREIGAKVRIEPNQRLAGWVRFSAMGVPSYAGASPGNGSLYVCDSLTRAMHTRVVLAPVGRVHQVDTPGDSGDLCLSRSS